MTGSPQPPGIVTAAEEAADVQAVCATIRTEFVRLGEQLRVDLGRELRLSLQATAQAQQHQQLRQLQQQQQQQEKGCTDVQASAKRKICQASTVAQLDDDSEHADSEDDDDNSDLFDGEMSGSLFTPKNFIHMTLKSRKPEVESPEEQPLKATPPAGRTCTESETLRQTARLQVEAKSEDNPKAAAGIVAGSTIKETPLEAFQAEPDFSTESHPAVAVHGEEATGTTQGASPDKNNLGVTWGECASGGDTAHINVPSETPPAAHRAKARRLNLPKINPHKAMGLVPSITRQEPLKRQKSGRVYQCIARVVCSRYFDWFFLTLNFLSAAMIGIETEVTARHLPESKSPWFFFSDICFLVFFVVESSLRLGIHGLSFFRMSGWGWNLFDLILVTLQLINVVFVRQLLDGPQSLNSTYYPRMVSLLRTVKVGRVVVHVDHFRLLWSCVMHSFPSFFFAFALVAMLNYVMANYIVQVITALRYSDSISHEHRSEIAKFYATVPEAWFSLVLGLTGGVDWNDIVSPLREGVDTWVSFCVICLMVFLILSIMNVVTGTFVQNAMEQAEEEKQVNKVQRAKRLFESMDVDSSGTIAYNELTAHLETEEVQTYFETLDVDPNEAKFLFKMLDMNDSGSIDFDEFLSGCIRLQGPAKSMDLLLVARDMRHAFQRLMSRMQRLYQVQSTCSIPGTLQERPPGAAQEQHEEV